MVRSRLVNKVGDVRKGLLSQRNSSGEMEHFRHTHQEMGPVMEHVEATAHKVNGAPQLGNTNDWHYIGSIPLTVLMKYLKDNRIPMDAFARNDNGCKDKFKKWFLGNRDMAKFNASYYKGRDKRIFLGS